MEDHQNHPQYGIPLPQPSPHFSSDLFGFNIVSGPDQHHRVQFTDHEMGFLPRGVQGLTVAGPNSNTVVASTSGGGGGFSGFTDGGETGRWPRQETLMLLEVRSRLDHKFKEANQKGPLWDEVSRIMSEEHGYTRSGKKCREKFENLYKYYKKTKEGKAGRRQDGKNYRFFRQLEAICGESKDSTSCYNDTQFMMTHALQSFHEPSPNIHNIFPQHQKLLTNTQSLSLSNNFSSSELGLTSSSEENGSDRSNRTHWNAKIEEFIGVHMERLIEKQDVWLEKLMKTMEDKEHQRMLKEEEWRRVDAARIDKERLFWAKERERMEARDVAVIEALQYLTGKALMRQKSPSPVERSNEKGSDQKMTIADEENKNMMEKEQMNKKRKENWTSRGECFSRKEENMMIYNNQETRIHRNCSQDDENMNEQGDHVGCSSSSNSKEGNPSRDIAMATGTNCFPLLIGDGDQNLWEGYGLKLRKGDRHQ